jgi:hypothetical protein
MTNQLRKFTLLSGFCLAVGFSALWPLMAPAQWPYGAPITPDTQRNALNAVRAQVNWFQNTTRTAPNYGENGYGNVLQQFQAIRGAYSELKAALTPQHAAAGANAFAELDAGLDILEEAFTNCQNDVASGRLVRSALSDMCQVLRQGSRVWLDELNRNCNALRLGWG